MRKRDEHEFLVGIALGFIVFLFLFVIVIGSRIVKGAVPTDVLQAIEDNEQTEVTEEEIEMLAHLVMAEAGNQDLLGKQLVVDVVFNRIRDNRFDNTVKEVIYAPGQFTCCGYFMRKKPTEECYEAVYTEIEQRQDREVLYFRTGRYGSTKALYKHGDHYFSK